MFTDIRALMLAQDCFNSTKAAQAAYFDLFFRKLPDGGGFAIAAGLEQAVCDIQSLRFDDNDIDALRTLSLFDDAFLECLRRFKFSGDLWAVPEGTPVFPLEPLITVHAPMIDAVLIETLLLSAINHQSLIATKAGRITRTACGREVVECGCRSAHGQSAALLGARAAYIGGCEATTCLLAAQQYDLPLLSTMSPAWVQLFDSELDAFLAYARKHPDDCVLTVDTYDALRSGVPHAIVAFKQAVLPLGHRPKAVMISSGDLAYTTKKARKMLDAAGFPDCRIIAGNALDEVVIRDMLLQGAKADVFCVGERLITAASAPIFSGVYSLCAVEQNGAIIPKIRLSENAAKITVPGFKCPWRLFDRDSGKAIADVITLHDEGLDDSQEYELFDPDHTWNRKTVGNFVARRLQMQIFKAGTRISPMQTAAQIRDYCRTQVGTLWEEVLRFENPHKYYVDLSPALWKIRNQMLDSR